MPHARFRAVVPGHADAGAGRLARLPELRALRRHREQPARLRRTALGGRQLLGGRQRRRVVPRGRDQRPPVRRRRRGGHRPVAGAPAAGHERHAGKRSDTDGLGRRSGRQRAVHGAQRRAAALRNRRCELRLWRAARAVLRGAGPALAAAALRRGERRGDAVRRARVDEHGRAGERVRHRPGGSLRLRAAVGPGHPRNHGERLGGAGRSRGCAADAAQRVPGRRRPVRAALADRSAWRAERLLGRGGRPAQPAAAGHAAA